MGKKCNLKRFVFLIVLVLSMLAQSSLTYLSYAENKNDETTIVNEIIYNDNADTKSNTLKKTSNSTNKVSMGYDGVISNEKPNGTIETGNFESNMVRRRVIRNTSRSVVEGVPDWVSKTINPISDLPNPGDVKVYEPIIVEDPIFANRGSIRLLVSARDTVNTSKIVLVIDKSGSMNDNNRLVKAKEAANAFVDRVLNNNSDSTQIGIVSFSRDAKVESSFTSDKNVLKNKINAITAKDGTFSQVGLRQAREMLKNSNSNKKYIVLLSDGIPTYSYAINNPDLYATEKVSGVEASYGISERWIKNGLATNSDIPESEFKTESVGNGRYMYDIFRKSGIFSSDPDLLYNHCNSTIAEAGFAKNVDKIDKLFTIGLQTDEIGSSVLKKMASDTNSFYEVQNINDLTPVFESIASKIVKATKEARVDVNFSKGFLLPKKIDVNKINNSTGTEVEIINGEPKWKIGTISSPLDENNYPGVKFAWVEFPFTIDDNILKNNNPENGISPLGKVNLKYKDQSGVNKNIDFPEKRIKPILFVLNKNVTDNVGGSAADSDLREFCFDIVKKADNSVVEKIYLRPGEHRILNNIEKGKDYLVYESKKAKVYENDLNGAKSLEFDVDTYYSNFSITGVVSPIFSDAPSSGVGKALNLTVPKNQDGTRIDPVFNNTEESEARAVISIRKNIEASNNVKSGMLSNDDFPDRVFKINITRKKGVISGHENEHNWTQEVKAGEISTIPHKMRFTTYKVSEDLDSASPYLPKPGEQNKEVTISLYKVLEGGSKGQVIDFTNVYVPNSSKIITATKKWVGGNIKDHKKVKLNLYRRVVGQNNPELVSNLSPIITPDGDVTGNKFEYKWSVPAFDSNGKEFIYTVKEAGTTNIDGEEFMVVGNNKYKVTQADNVITNTYVKPENISIEVTKIWEDGKNKNIPKPNVNITLYRHIVDGDEELVPNADVKLINGEILNAKWENIDKVDNDGNPYIFVVKESFKDNDINNDNWNLVLQKEVKNNKVELRNTLKEEKELGKLSLTKKIKKNSSSNSTEGTKFKIKISGPVGFLKIVELADGESIDLNDLYFGSYKVEEVDIKSYVPSYNVDKVETSDGMFVLSKKENARKIEVINKKKETNSEIPSEPSNPSKPEYVERVDGDDRIETAIEISKKYFGKANTVIVARSDLYPDSLTSTILSKLLNSPILLTPKDKLDERVRQEILRLEAKEIIIVGGTDSVSNNVKNELEKIDKNGVERISGLDRYGTSEQVARKVISITGKKNKAVIASGEVFPDALAISSFAAREGYPILLIKKNKVPDMVQNALADLEIRNTFVVGGFNTISQITERNLPNVYERIGGKDRYETSMLISKKKFSNSRKAFIASGEVFSDALVIGPVAGRYDAPILLTCSKYAPKIITNYIKNSLIEKLTIVGGRKYIPDNVVLELKKY